jgi:hypothetical protein
MTSTTAQTPTTKVVGLWSLQLKHYYDWPEPARDAMAAFLDSHGIPSKRVLLDTTVEIEAVDDVQMLRVRITGEPAEACPYCDNCVKTEVMSAPLTSMPPALPGARTWRYFTAANGTEMAKTPPADTGGPFCLIDCEEGHTYDRGCGLYAEPVPLAEPSE